MKRAVASLPLGEILRFGCVGIGATLTHFLVLSVGVEAMSLPPTLANGLAFCVAVLVTYIGQSRWVFRSAAPATSGRLGRFAVSVLFGLFGNMAIMALGTRMLGLDYRTAFAIGVILIPVLTYLLNKFWVFGRDLA